MDDKSASRHRIISSLCSAVGMLLGSAVGMLLLHSRTAFILGAAAGTLIGQVAIEPVAEYFDRQDTKV